jgi:hypothetical protein
MRKLLFLLGCTLLLLAAVAAPALADGAGSSPPPPPAGSQLVMNAAERYTNWEDGGNVGYWALLGAAQTVRVWQVSPGSFYLITRYLGTWTTYPGVPSPNCSTDTGPSFGLPVATSRGSGTWCGWVAYSFDATAYTPKFGYLGTFDDGGTKADVLLGHYVDPVSGDQLQVGSDHEADAAFLEYFTIENWDNFLPVGGYWEYRYRNQRMVWTWSPEAGNVISGNIVVQR